MLARCVIFCVSSVVTRRLVSFSLLVCALTARGAVITEGRQDVLHFQCEVLAAFTNNDFELLENTARDLRVNKVRLPAGSWLLPYFYMTFEPEGVDLKEQDFLAWQKKYPTSPTPRIALAYAMTWPRWIGRGGNQAVGSYLNMRQQRKEYVAQARKILEDADQLPEKCPDWYRVMLQIGLYQRWTPAEFEALFERAVAIEPTYNKYYQVLAEYLFQTGRPWAKPTEEAVRKFDSSEGLIAYVEAVMQMVDPFYNVKVFKAGVDWPTLK